MIKFSGIKYSTAVGSGREDLTKAINAKTASVGSMISES
jgi:hypothetical protein